MSGEKSISPRASRIGSAGRNQCIQIHGPGVNPKVEAAEWTWGEEHERNYQLSGQRKRSYVSTAKGQWERSMCVLGRKDTRSRSARLTRRGAVKTTLSEWKIFEIPVRKGAGRTLLKSRAGLDKNPWEKVEDVYDNAKGRKVLGGASERTSHSSRMGALGL